MGGTNAITNPTLRPVLDSLGDPLIYFGLKPTDSSCAERQRRRKSALRNTKIDGAPRKTRAALNRWKPENAVRHFFPLRNLPQISPERRGGARHENDLAFVAIPCGSSFAARGLENQHHKSETGITRAFSCFSEI
jgi:hypothetical protein